jgi:hypothetical protein
MNGNAKGVYRVLKLIRASCFIVFCLLLSLPASAQDTTNPLLDMLKLVPDNEETQAGVPLVNYVDYRAVEQARGIDKPPTKADFDNQTDTSGLWIAASNGVMSGMRLDYFMQYLEGMEQAVGFSWFDINQALTFGNPPSMGVVLTGTFDANAIAAAFKTRDFTSKKQDDTTVWCGPNGCDEGQKTNVANRDPANPFGGDLGRDEPFALLTADIVADSADYGVLSAILDTHQGKQASLADNSTVQAAANVITGKGTLRQAQFFNGADVGDYSQMVATDSPDSDQPDSLPTYALAFFADLYSNDEQSALIGLVYDDEESAQTATALLIDHLQMAQSVVRKQPFMDLIEAREGHITGATVETDAATGKFIALLDIRYPMPSNEKQDTGYTASSLVFKLLIDAIYQRDATWLAADFAAPQ